MLIVRRLTGQGRKQNSANVVTRIVHPDTCGRNATVLTRDCVLTGRVEGWLTTRCPDVYDGEVSRAVRYQSPSGVMLSPVLFITGIVLLTRRSR